MLQKTNAKKRRKAGAGPGRRPAGSPPIDREIILARGLELARSLSLRDISMARIASEFGVTAAAIRYHLDARDELTAGVLNMFYREMLASWPTTSGDWKSDVSAVAETIYRHYLRYPGIAAYFAAENRFRILAVAVQAEDGAAPRLFLERYFAVVRELGLDVERTTTYAIILLHVIHMAAHATARHQWPGEHDLLTRHLKAIDSKTFPNIAAMRESYLRLEGEVAFKAALGLILSGLEFERSK